MTLPKHAPGVSVSTPVSGGKWRALPVTTGQPANGASARAGMQHDGERLAVAGDGHLFVGFDLLPALAGFGSVYANSDKIQDLLRYVFVCQIVVSQPLRRNRLAGKGCVNRRVRRAHQRNGIDVRGAASNFTKAWLESVATWGCSCLRRPVHRRFLLSRSRHFEHFPEWNFQAVQCGEDEHFIRSEHGALVETIGAIQETDGVMLQRVDQQVFAHTGAFVVGFFSRWSRVDVAGESTSATTVGAPSMRLNMRPVTRWWLVEGAGNMA